MKTVLIATLAIGSLAIGVAQAEGAKNPDPMPGASKDECVFIRTISNWHVLDSRHIVLYAPQSRAYLLELGSPISDLKFAFKVAFIDRDSDGQLCGRSLDKVQAVGSSIRQPPAIIMGMTRLNDAGLQALETQYNVKLTRKKKNQETPPAS